MGLQADGVEIWDNVVSVPGLGVRGLWFRVWGLGFRDVASDALHLTR